LDIEYFGVELQRQTPTEVTDHHMMLASIASCFENQLIGFQPQTCFELNELDQTQRCTPVSFKSNH